MTDPLTQPCPQCSAPLTAEQRFCVQCGTPRVDADASYAAVWDRLPDSLVPGLAPDAAAAAATAGATPVAAAAAAAPGPGGPGGAPNPKRRRRPSRSLSGIAVGATLLLGVVVGAVLSPGPSSSSAASGTPVLVMGSAPTATTPAVTADPVVDEPADDVVDDVVEDPITPDAGTTDDTTVTPSDTATDDTATDDDTASDDEDTGDAGDGGTDLGDVGDAGTDGFTPPKASHVWVITLSGQSYAGLFGPTSAMPYLRTELTPKGALLKGYTPSATTSLSTGIALLSGQAPNDATANNCPTYVDVAPATVDAKTGLAAGAGCVYPKEARTLADQLTDNARTWKSYAQSQGTACRHPEVGQADPWPAVTPLSAFLTQRSPFVFFRSLLDGGACAERVVDLDALAGDLKDTTKTPTLSWIVPDGLHDGHDVPVSDGGPGGPAAADGFLKSIVPQITATKAYRDGGLILVVPDRPAPPGPEATTVAPTGALVLSPKVKAGAVVKTPFTPYALLRSLEDAFDVSHLGHAADEGTPTLDEDVYTAASTSNTL